MNVSQQVPLTSWRAQMESQVRTQNECRLARGTHFLEILDRETSQDMEKMQVSKGHPHPGAPRQRDKSGHGRM